jgi:hypothetical protein
MVQLATPDHAGSRDQVDEMVRGLPADLRGVRVELNCSNLLVGTPSFFDEIVKQILVVRHADTLDAIAAPERVRQLLERAAENRGVRGRIRVALRAA